MKEEVLDQADIDKLVESLKDKQKAKKKNEELSQEEIDSVIKEFETLTNTDLSQDDIDRIISTFDQEYKPV